MPDTGYLAIFLVGLLSGAHCVGMCGGIVSALSVANPGAAPSLARLLAYNLGRIGAYTLLGGAMGAVGSAGLLFNGFLPFQLGFYVLANLLLVATGFYLLGWTQLLLPVERLGQGLWRRIAPLRRRFVGGQHAWQALPMGFLWGFLPCGLTYSALSTALMSGSALHGAALMAAFGAGTLPNLLLAGLMLARYKDFARSAAFRTFAGLVVLSFGVYGLIRAPELGGQLWAGVICKV